MANNIEEENKVLCVSVAYKDDTRHWFAIDPRSKSKSEEGREIVRMRDYPPYMDHVLGFGIAVLDSKIYLLGGSYQRGMHQDLKEVYIFDTVDGSWSEGPPMKEARAWPVVQVIGRKIYVFGTEFIPYKYMDISVEHWAECYDLDSDCEEWQTLSGPTQEPERFFSNNIDAVVVYQDQILFWVAGIGIYAYNHRSNVWIFLSEGFANNGPEPSFAFMANHVVIGDFALWQYYGKIYAWDLTNNQTSVLCTLPGVRFSASLDPHAVNPPPGPSNLLHAGNGLLCFLRWNLYNAKPNVCCYKFQLKGSTQSSGTGACHLDIIPVGNGIQFFDVPGYGIEHAIALTAGCMGSI